MANILKATSPAALVDEIAKELLRRAAISRSYAEGKSAKIDKARSVAEAIALEDFATSLLDTSVQISDREHLATPDDHLITAMRLVLTHHRGLRVVLNRNPAVSGTVLWVFRGADQVGVLTRDKPETPPGEWRVSRIARGMPTSQRTFPDIAAGLAHIAEAGR